MWSRWWDLRCGDSQAGPDVAEKMLNQGGHFYVCGSARQVPEDIYTAMKEAPCEWMGEAPIHQSKSRTSVSFML